MRATLVFALKELRQRLRDRSALMIAFVAPFGLAVIISFAFGGGFADSFEATYAVADLDGSEIGNVFSDQVLQAPGLREQIAVRPVSSEREARDVVRATDVAAAFVIPKGFGSSVMASRRASITVLGNAEAPIGYEVARALARGFTDQLNASRLSVVTTLRAAGGPPDPARVAEIAAQSARERIPVELDQRQVGKREVTGANYFGPGMTIFFLFFTTSFAARSLVAERQQGTLPRILAAPISRTSIVAGKSIAVFLLGITSMAVMFVSLGFLFDVRWGDPAALIALSLLIVLALLGLTALVQTLARTREQADAYSSAVAVSLALLGGNFFPLFQMPEAIQRLSLVTPNGWAMRGFTDVGYDGAGLGDVLPNLAAIAAFALVTGAFALWRARRTALA